MDVSYYIWLLSKLNHSNCMNYASFISYHVYQKAHELHYHYLLQPQNSMISSAPVKIRVEKSSSTDLISLWITQIDLQHLNILIPALFALDLFYLYLAILIRITLCIYVQRKKTEITIYKLVIW